MGEEYQEFDLRFLRGNHEETFQDFLMNSGIGHRWAQYGGIETLVSYNVQPPRGRDNFDGWEEARLDLVKKNPIKSPKFPRDIGSLSCVRGLCFRTRWSAPRA